MSHDQKPGKVRVVGNAAAAPQRRRSDGSAANAVVVSPSVAGGSVASGSAGPGQPVAAGSGKPPMLLVALFIVGCAIGGAVLPLLGIVR